MLKLQPLSKMASPSLTPICLPDTVPLRTFSFEGMACYATGWGRGEAAGAGPLRARLQETKVPVLPTQVCAEKYNSAQYGFAKISDAHLCAGVLDGSTGTCVVSIWTSKGLRATRRLDDAGGGAGGGHARTQLFLSLLSTCT